MPKIQIKIDPKSGLAYFPKAVRAEGFVGPVEGLPNVHTITLFRPGTKLADIKKSLHIILQDLELRRAKEEAEDQAEKDKE